MEATKLIYDLKRIMKMAWACVKKHGMTMSAAMKWAWKTVKREKSDNINTAVKKIAFDASKGGRHYLTVNMFGWVMICRDQPAIIAETGVVATVETTIKGLNDRGLNAELVCANSGRA